MGVDIYSRSGNFSRSVKHYTLALRRNQKIYSRKSNWIVITYKNNLSENSNKTRIRSRLFDLKISAIDRKTNNFNKIVGK